MQGIFKFFLLLLQEEAKGQSISLVQGLMQVSMLLQACPAANDPHIHGPMSPFLTSHLSAAAHMQSGDELWIYCVDRIKVIQNETDRKGERERRGRAKLSS